MIIACVICLVLCFIMLAVNLFVYYLINTKLKIFLEIAELLGKEEDE